MRERSGERLCAVAACEVRVGAERRWDRSAFPPGQGVIRPGDAVVVPASLWPAYSCRELGGAGWTATVRRVHTSTARVSFDVAQTRDGRPYEDELLPLDELRVPVV